MMASWMSSRSANTMSAKRSAAASLMASWPPSSSAIRNACVAVLILLGVPMARADEPKADQRFPYAFATRGCTQEDAPALEIYFTEAPFKGDGTPAPPYLRIEIASRPNETIASLAPRSGQTGPPCPRRTDGDRKKDDLARRQDRPRGGGAWGHRIRPLRFHLAGRRRLQPQLQRALFQSFGRLRLGTFLHDDVQHCRRRLVGTHHASGNPSINRMFCTAAPDAPLPRLSSRATSTAWPYLSLAKT
jgi:hypothetical protein